MLSKTKIFLLIWILSLVLSSKAVVVVEGEMNVQKSEVCLPASWFHLYHMNHFVLLLDQIVPCLKDY